MSVDRWFIGKDYEKLNTIIDKHDELKHQFYFQTCLYVLIILCLLLFMLIVFFNDFEGNYNSEENYNISKIEYEGLNKAEKKNVNNILSEVDKIYFVYTKKIKFTNNITQYCDDCNGRNYGDGNLVIVSYRDNLDGVKRTLCHELIHSFVIKDNDNSTGHNLVYDLAEKGVCYKKHEE